MNEPLPKPSSEVIAYFMRLLNEDMAKGKQPIHIDAIELMMNLHIYKNQGGDQHARDQRYPNFLDQPH